MNTKQHHWKNGYDERMNMMIKQNKEEWNKTREVQVHMPLLAHTGYYKEYYLWGAGAYATISTYRIFRWALSVQEIYITLTAHADIFISDTHEKKHAITNGNIWKDEKERYEIQWYWFSCSLT